ncbi:MAG: hypothetical protein CVT66_11430 [Actinobacteria bacterium HGW-Actinobacteria-6]|jgi:hypothetical protein|nr:MAG: hypothetical protein CVT66_11430 [Actinobacteria bacterium HGW-Actinobacteria-6]
MPTISARWRFLPAVSGILLGAVALVVAVGVIPLVRAGSVANMTPDRAVPAFWVTVGIHLLAAAVLFLVVTLSENRSWISTSALFVTGVAILLVGFALGDAAKAPLETGAPMQAVTAMLLGCVAADVLAGALAIAAARIRPARA